MEQRQLAWLITTRSQVRVLVPQPKYEPHQKMGFLFWLWGLGPNRASRGPRGELPDGSSDENKLLKTGFQRCFSGVAERDRVLVPMFFAKVPGSVISHRPQRKRAPGLMCIVLIPQNVSEASTPNQVKVPRDRFVPKSICFYFGNLLPL